jgi:small-conductance mechanosensitive channel/CRP-like cAMP-binding protein
MGAGITIDGKLGKSMLRIWFPLTVFTIFMMMVVGKEELYSRFLSNFSGVGRVIFEYGSQIGVWFSGAFLAQRFISIFVWDGVVAGISGRMVPRLPKDFTGILLFGIAFMGVLATVFNQSITGIWATSGVFGIVLGIALRNVILDVFIGLSMHVEQSFRIGDWVMVHQNRRENHIVGQVVEINWRTTRLKTTEKNMVVVPNSRMGEAILTNYMQPKPYFRIDLEFILDYNITPNRAIRLLLGAIKSLVDDSRILNDPEPEVRLDEALGHGQKYEVRFFILPTGVSPKESRHIVNRRVLEHLARSGISPAMEKEIVYIEKSSNKNSKVPSSSLDVSGVLYSNSLFSSLQKEDIDHLEGYFVKRECKAGETLFRQGNKGNSMYLLAEGLLYAEIRYEQEVEKTYREQIEPSEHFGEECVLGPNVRSASVTAVTDCLVLELAADQVMEVARKNGTFLSMLNQETSLSKFKTLEGKRKLLQSAQSKFSEVRLKKPLSSSIQTFFTDLFPSAPSPKK